MSNRRPYLIGVTGNIACGKSTVMTRLAELGAETLDADRTYHSLIAPGRPLVQTLGEAFGPEIIAPDGTIDRRALGRIVFADSERLKQLEGLTHPAVRAETRRLIAASDRPIVAIDAVKLMEGGLADECDQIWLVVCDPEVQLRRLMARNNLSEADAEMRLSAQPPLADKRARATAVIDNSGSIEETRAVVDRLWETVPQSARTRAQAFATA